MTDERLLAHRARAAALIADILLWCILCSLLVAGFINAGAVSLASPVSLRYNAPISGKAAYNARLYSIENGGEDAFWPTFWREDSASFSSELVTASMGCIVYSGDAWLVWPAEYLYGSAPGVTDGTGCAVSSALAWRLWGGTDVVGMTVEVDNAERTVRGVFEDVRELALLSVRDEDTSQSFDAVELSGGPRGATSDDARSFAAAAGLGQPDTVLMGSGPSFLADSLAALPLIILAIYGLSLVFTALHRRFTVMRRLTPYIVILCLAVCLPGLLGLLPTWMIPTRWSDFTFWSELAQRLSDSVREFLSAAPGLRDVELRLLLIKQGGIAILSVCCALSVCFRWAMRSNFIRTGRQHG